MQKKMSKKKAYRHARMYKKRRSRHAGIAVTYEDGKVFKHFGHTGNLICDVDNQKIKQTQVVSAGETAMGLWRIS